MKCIHKWINKLKFKMKLRKMDKIHYLCGGGCFSLFPPSFYYTHTPEEVEKITEECLAKLQKMLDEFEDSIIE